MKKVAEKGSTLFLRLALIGVGVIVFALCAWLLPEVQQHWGTELPQIANKKYPVLIGLSATALTFYYALFQGWKLLDYIDKNTAFSRASVKALEKIKQSAFVIAAIYAVGITQVFHFAEHEDAPGLILMYGAIFVGVPLVVAVAVAVLQRLLQSAIAMKSENDLTV